MKICGFWYQTNKVLSWSREGLGKVFRHWVVSPGLLRFFLISHSLCGFTRSRVLIVGSYSSFSHLSRGRWKLPKWILVTGSGVCPIPGHSLWNLPVPHCSSLPPQMFLYISQHHLTGVFRTFLLCSTGGVELCLSSLDPFHSQGVLCIVEETGLRAWEKVLEYQEAVLGWEV